MNRTSIPWVVNPDGSPGFTWNPLVGCSHASPGCSNCWAETLASTRLAHRPEYAGLTKDGSWTGEVRFLPERLAEPLQKRKPSTIAVSLMGDLFHERVTFQQIAVVFGVMAACPQHMFWVLTKRAKRMRECMAWLENCDIAKITCKALDAIGFERGCGSAFEADDWPLPNVRMGVTCCNQDEVDRNVSDLRETPAAFRYLSMEPLLEGTAFRPCRHCNTHGDVSAGWPCRYCGGRRFEIPDLIIVGGESGPRARPCHVEWIRDIVRQCQDAGTRVFVKQVGANCREHNGNEFLWPEGTRFTFDEDADDALARVCTRDRAGADPAEWPHDMRARQLP